MKFVAFERTKQGTGASRRLRHSGRTPGIVYGGKAHQPVNIELDHNALWHALKKEAFHASILEMELSGQTSKVLLRDVQYPSIRANRHHLGAGVAGGAGDVFELEGHDADLAREAAHGVEIFVRSDDLQIRDLTGRRIGIGEDAGAEGTKGAA